MYYTLYIVLLLRKIKCIVAVIQYIVTINCDFCAEMDRLFRYGLVLVVTALLYEWMHWSTPEAVIARRWMVMSASSMTQYKGIAVG